MPTVPGTKERHQDKAQDSVSHIVLPASDYSAWPDIEGARLVELGGSLDALASCPFDELLRAVENLPKEATISLRIDAAEMDENPAAFERIMGTQKKFSDRAYVDFDIASADAFYARTEKERRRVVFLSDAATQFIDLGAPVRWLIPLTHALVYKLETLFSQARRNGVEAMIASFDAEGLDPNDRLFAADFVRYRILEEESGLLSAAQRLGYEALLNILDGGDARSVNDICTNLLSAGPNAVRGGQESPKLDFMKDAAGVLIDGARAHLLRSFTPEKRDNEAVAAARFKKVLLIGAYGGEHIGDAAILGGVAFRLHARHGVANAILMTQRPAHTRHLIPMIETPVEIEVREYCHREIDAAIDEVDAVIFAGGPIVDLPKQLVRHLYTVSRAKARGKPFLMVGVGPGPLHRLPSRVTVRRTITLADYVSLRTQESAEAEIIKGLNVEVGRDPAFDYLETRQGELSKMPAHEVSELERLLDGADGRPVIGVNIRPVYHQYTVGVKDGDKAEYTKMVEDRFERRLAEALTNFSRKNASKPVIVFFPMNAVQFGLSDLKSAYRIGQHMGEDIDYRVWEADVSLDGVLALIRRLDIAITMRFHATIFALSQEIETIGVDYRIGKRDKVAAVLSDAGKGDQCMRIDEMTAEWLAEQLDRLAGGAFGELEAG